MAGRDPGHQGLPRPVRKPDSLRDPERFQPAVVPAPEGRTLKLFPVARDKALDFGEQVRRRHHPQLHDVPARVIDEHLDVAPESLDGHVHSDALFLGPPQRRVEGLVDVAEMIQKVYEADLRGG
jgi:hypothetical protein